MINFISIYQNESLLIQIVSETIVALLRYFDKLLAFIFRVFIPISFQLVSHETGFAIFNNHSSVISFKFLAKTIRPDDVCNKLITSKSTCCPINFLALSTTTIVPSSK